MFFLQKGMQKTFKHNSTNFGTYLKLGDFYGKFISKIFNFALSKYVHRTAINRRFDAKS